MFKRKREEQVFRENLELHYKVKVLEREIELVEEKWTKSWTSLTSMHASELTGWKERGNKYAVHNDALQKSLYDMHQAIVGILNNPERLAAYKSILEKFSVVALADGTKK